MFFSARRAEKNEKIKILSPLWGERKKKTLQNPKKPEKIIINRQSPTVFPREPAGEYRK